MPIIKTNQFWDYIINEPLVTMNKTKDLLTRKYYNFDKKEYDIHKYWQTISCLEINSFSFESIRFPGGLTSWLSSKLGIAIEYKNYNQKEWTKEEILKIANEVHETNKNFEVRDYQIEAVETSLNQFRSLINASVGSGKTSIMSLVCKCLLRDNKKILILNGNNLILGQIAKRLESFGINDISWNPGKEPDFTKQIVIMNIANSDSRLNLQDKRYINYLKNDVETICYDEAHHIQSVTAFEPLFYTNPDKLKHIIGYSGSPFRNKKNPFDGAEDFRTIAIIGEPAFNYEMKDAINDGNIAQPYGYFIHYKNKEAKIPPMLNNKDYYTLYRFNITYNKARNTAGFEMLKFLNKYNIKTFVSVNNTKLAQKKMKELKETNIKSILICGNETLFEWIEGPRGGLKLEKRKGGKEEALQALNTDYNIIFGTSVLDEGVSIDIFQAAILFSAGRTNIAGIQRLGRASRKRQNGQNVSFVIDFQDSGGYPVFEQHYNERRQIMIDSGIKLFNNAIDFINFIKQISEENKK